MTILISFLFIVSLCFNVVLYWFNKKMITQTSNIEHDLTELYIILKQYSRNVDNFYNMEAYFGDPQVQKLKQDTKYTKENLEDFMKIYFEETLEEDEEKEEN